MTRSLRGDHRATGLRARRWVAQRPVEALRGGGDEHEESAPLAGADHPGGWVVDGGSEEPHAPCDRVGTRSRPGAGRQVAVASETG